MELLHLSDVLLVELLRVRCLVEVQVAAEDLVGALPAQNHLHARRLDAPRHEVHGRGRADGRDVEALQVVDDVLQSVDALLRRERVLVVHGVEVLGHLAGRREVRTGLQADAERVQLGPVGRLAAVGLYPPVAVPGHDRGHERGVQAATQQHAIRHVRHQVRHHGALEGLAERVEVDGHRRARHRVPPTRRVEEPPLLARRVVDVARGEELVPVAALVQRLQLAGHVDGAVRAPAHVQGDDADGVPGDDVCLLLHVPEDKRKHAANRILGEEVDAILRVEMQEDLAVAASHELVLARCASLQLLPQLHVVVDLPVHAQHQVPRLVVEGLVAAVGVHDGQALMRDERAPLAVHAAPVRAPVPEQLGGVHDVLAHFLRLLDAKQRQDAAHGRRR
mmetsp:Transcript_23956/g.68591  ORF Transcript_23956/g.68591 Transcript_23956/m.68591 type:complete len:392 (-) Transcript_23956:92-1267(-)